MTRAKKTKDLLTKMNAYEYLYALMQIPLSDSVTRANGANFNGQCCPKTRQFGQYRGLCLREGRVKRSLEAITAELIAAENEGIETVEVFHKRRRLRELTLEAARLKLRRRECEQLLNTVENSFVRAVVQHRYFEDITRRLPTWQDTAKELGIGISGEELRSFVCAELRK